MNIMSRTPQRIGNSMKTRNGIFFENADCLKNRHGHEKDDWVLRKSNQ